MLTHEQTRELINEIGKLIIHAEQGSIDYSVLEHARKLVFHAQIELDRLPTEDEVKDDLKEIAHYFVGWPELREVAQKLEDDHNEAVYERTHYEGDGNFADNH